MATEYLHQCFGQPPWLDIKNLRVLLFITLSTISVDSRLGFGLHMKQAAFLLLHVDSWFPQGTLVCPPTTVAWLKPSKMLLEGHKPR